MSVHFLAAIVGALIAAAGTGVLAARCLRVPNAALVAWTVALFGLTVALGAQALGFQIGFGSIAFRAMQIGAQVLAPLALVLGLSELSGRSIISRFAARLLLTALAIVALVIFVSDPLSAAQFSKAWPAATVYYQIVPNKLLEYVLAPATVIVALSAMVSAALRPGRDPAWRDAVPPAVSAGLAALLLSVPGIATLAGVNVPLGSLFVPLCILAAAGTWFAGTQVGRLSLQVLHADVDADADSADGGWGSQHSWAGPAGPETGDFDPVAADDEFGIYRSNGSHRQREDLDYHGQADYTGQQAAYPGEDGYRGDRYPNEAGHLDDGPMYRDETGYPGEAGYRDGAGYPGPGGQEFPSEAGPLDGPLYRDETGYPGGARSRGESGYLAGGGPADGHAEQESLFGQIAIYTLLEDRVEDFDRLTRRVVRQVRTQEPDTLVYIVHAVPSAPMQRILYEVYRDRAAYEAHKRQAYVISFEHERRPFVLATNIIELGLQQAKVSPLPSVSDLLSDTGFDLLSDTGFGQPGYGPRPSGGGARG
jgi:quinol monooxygenase YgiN